MNQKINCVEVLDPDKDQVLENIARKSGSYVSIDSPKDVMADRIHAGRCPICDLLIDINKIVYVNAPSGIFEENIQVAICLNHRYVK